MIKLISTLFFLQFLFGFNYKNYGGFIECNSKSHIEIPETLEELQSIVSTAINTGTTVKVIGSRHSYTDVICTEGIPIKLSNFKKVEVNLEDMTASIGTGIGLKDAQDILHSSGVIINHTPAYGGITIGGAIGTGAHGSSLKHPNTLSEYIIALKFIDGQGSLRTIKVGDSDFDAFRVNFGLLGIVIEATFKVVPSYKLKIHNYKVNDDLLLNHSEELINMARKNDWFQFYWFPTTSGLVISEGNKVSNKVIGNARAKLPGSLPLLSYNANTNLLELLQYTNSTRLMNQMQKDTESSFYKETFGKEGLFVDENDKFANPAIGYSHNLMSAKCDSPDSCIWGNGIDKFYIIPLDLAISLPITKLSDVVNDMNKIFDKYPTPFPWMGLFFRLSSATRGIMSIANGEDHFHIELVTVLRKNQFEDAPFSLSIIQSLYQLFVNKHGGRPHWGKTGLAFLTNGIVSSRYDLESFQSAMQKYDPKGLFLNNFGKRLLGSSVDKFDIPEKVTKCAIQNYCICKTDSDCPKNSKCGSLVGYKVCY